MRTLILIAAAVAMLPAADIGDRIAAPEVTVHEWGTFTSVAGLDGDPVMWAPLQGKADLPCFVVRLDSKTKYRLGMIRMETPVLYFYAPRPATLSVRVDFPEGWITEWYPQATATFRRSAPFPVADSSIRWDQVEVLPGADLAFPGTEAPSHYYAARETDAAPLRLATKDGLQQEKMIFYRGIGSFEPALRARYLDDGRLELRNAGEEPITTTIVFENRDGRQGYRVVHDLRDTAAIAPPALDSDAAELPELLAKELQAAGLYKKEALAMVETWRDSWFEPGTRIFYLVPKADVDALLPLTIKPTPAAVERVFVGRVEVLSPATREMIDAALATNDQATIQRMGRFLPVFAKMMGREAPGGWDVEGPACIQ